MRRAVCSALAYVSRYSCSNAFARFFIASTLSGFYMNVIVVAAPHHLFMTINYLSGLFFCTLSGQCIDHYNFCYDAPP